MSIRGIGGLQMFRSFSAPAIQTLAWAGTITGALCIGSIAVCLISQAGRARAEPLTKAEVHLTHAKGDRLPVLEKGAPCSSRAWPYYEPRCQFDLRRPFGDMPTVRIIALR